jgi:hypothetical protein
MLHRTMRNDRIERTLRWHARNFNEQLIAFEPLGLASNASREAKLARLDAIATVRGIATANVRAGYRSGTAVKYVE